MNIFTFSRYEAEHKLLPYQQSIHLIISITTPWIDGSADEARLQITPTTGGVLRLSFHDLSDMPADVEAAVFKEEPHLRDAMFSSALAAQVLDFVIPKAPFASAILVHCDAGLSRSPGVAAALAKILLGDDREWFHKFHPNRRVYRLIVEEYISRLEKEMAP